MTLTPPPASALRLTVTKLAPVREAFAAKREQDKLAQAADDKPNTDKPVHAKAEAAS